MTDINNIKHNDWQPIRFWFGTPSRAEDRDFYRPLSWIKPRYVSVDAMLWFTPNIQIHRPEINPLCIDEVFAMMLLCKRHTFEIITPHTSDMDAYLSDECLYDRINSSTTPMLIRHPSITVIRITPFIDLRKDCPNIMFIDPTKRG